MLLTRGKLAGVGLLVVAVVALPAQAQVTLRYQFKEGEKLPYVMDQKMKMTMAVGGQNIEMNMNQTVDMTWNIQSVDKDGKAKMTQRFDRVRFTMEMPTGKIEYDSKDGKEPDDPIGKMIAPVFKAMVGSEFSLSMDARGRMSDVKVPDKLTEALKDIPGAAGLGDMFSGDAMKRMIDQSAMVLPEGPVTKGKSWEQKVETKTPLGKMKLDTTYTYEGPATKGDKKLEQVALKPKMEIEADAAAPVAIKVKDMDAKGTALFDNAAGRLVETNLTTNMEMEINAGGMNLSQKIEQVMTLKLAEKVK